ncbi:MAG: NAD(P)H-hydrate dehydratase [bacterium]|nr:NAD(P)H-hydrate dehydratase [bacterium]
MEYIVTTEQMRFCDRQTSAYYQIPETVLMERAALAVTQAALRMLFRGQGRRGCGTRVLVLCGGGNNGADGYAAARLLFQEGVEVCALFCGEEERRSDLNRMQAAIAQRYGVPCCDMVMRDGRMTICESKDARTEYDNKEAYDLVIDAVFGIGLSRPLEGTRKELLKEVGAWKVPVLAVDMPSGIDSQRGAVMGCALAADETVTFGFRKLGLMVNEGAVYAGRVSVAKIGITADSFLGETPRRFLLSLQDAAKMLPVRKRNGNKGTFGKLLLLAGSHDMSGACTLAAAAAYRAGAGMVRVLTCRENVPALQLLLPEALLTVVDASASVSEKKEKIREAADWADVIAAGCGIGTSDEMRETLWVLYDRLCDGMEEKPLILDADALNLIAALGDAKAFLRRRKPYRTVLTPHIGELSRLCGRSISEIKADFVRIAEEFAADTGCILVAKDARTYLCMADKNGVLRGCLNETGNDGMATAGSGDVLTGMIAAAAAVASDLFDAACVGVYLHGLSGECASALLGKEAVMASDLVAHISEAYRRIRAGEDRKGQI